MAKALIAALAAASMFVAPALAKTLPREWDGLVKVDAKKFDAAYLAPGADFHAYTKVMIDQPEAAFRKNWQRDYNQSTRDLSARISDDEVRETLTLVQDEFKKALVDAYREGGYQVVTEPAPDVIRIRSAVMNIDVMAPDRPTAGRSYTYSAEGGFATLVLEVRDSMSNAVLGRGVDGQEIGDIGRAVRRTRIENQGDFKQTFREWGKISVNALGKLKELPPVSEN